MRQVASIVATLTCCLTLPACKHEPSPHPARIMSGSMAERFYGEHWLVRCADCGFGFRCGVEHPPDGMLAICPNCGYRENKVDAAAKQSGMAVDVMPHDFANEPPQRWEVVAYHQGDSERIHVKRIAGLPGERLAIRGGDLFAGDKRVQKSLAEFREVAHLVYDDRYRPTFVPGNHEVDGRIGNPSYARWRSANDDSRWHLLSDGSGYRCRRAATTTLDVDWLEYHHWSCAATPTPRDADAPIRDNDSYNQSLSRAMNTVGDVALSFTVGQLQDGDDFLVRLYGGDKPLVVAMTPNSDTVRLMHGEMQLAEAPTSTPLLSGRNWNLTAAVVDGRVLVEIGGQEVLAFNLDAAGIEFDPADVALAIGSQHVFAEISNLQVFRDVYYLNPHARPDDWQMDVPLGETEYFVLGDNPPLSRDSRQSGSIAVGKIVGGVRPRSE